MAVVYSANVPAPSNDYFIYVTDGAGTTQTVTPGGIELGARAGGDYLVDFGDDIVFGFSGSGSSRGWDIWVTDGTVAGTGPIATDSSLFGNSFATAQISAGYLLSQGDLYGRGLYLGNLDVATVGLTVAEPLDFVSLGDSALFTGNNLFDGRAHDDLYVTDGTASGTRPVSEIGAENDALSSLADLQFSSVLNGTLVFTAEVSEEGGFELRGRSIWTYDQSSREAVRLDEVGAHSSITGVGEDSGNLVFVQRAIPGSRLPDPEGFDELWVLDRETAEARMLTDFETFGGDHIEPGLTHRGVFSNFSDPIVRGEDVYLIANFNGSEESRYLLMRFTTWLPGTPVEDREQGFVEYFDIRWDGMPMGMGDFDKILHEGRIYFWGSNSDGNSVFSIDVETGAIADHGITSPRGLYEPLSFLDVGVGVIVFAIGDSFTDIEMRLIRNDTGAVEYIGVYDANWTFGSRFVLEGNLVYYVDEDLVLRTYNLETGERTVLAEREEFARLLGTVPDSVLDAPVGIERDGTSGNDVLQGTEGNDLLTGRGGDDRLVALGGDDTLRGGDGVDTLNGGAGDDLIIGGEDDTDLRDVVYAGDGNDTVDGGHGNDDLNGGNGDDTIEGGFGVDRVVGNAGNDVLTGSAYSDLVFGGDGDDFVNGGFGHDRVNGGAGADRFFHVGVAGHGADWIQDYSASQSDVLVFGGSATRDQFQVNFTETDNAGQSDTAEAFVIYRPSGQILWALIDGESQSNILLRVGAEEFDLLA